MNRHPDAPDPLSPEERDLAERLLRLGPHDGPSPALDAKILAAARAAVAPEAAPEAEPEIAAVRAAAPQAATAKAAAAPPQAAAPQAATPRVRQKKNRWPAWIGIAASLTLAVGVAWQLRPLDKAPQAMSEAQVAQSAQDSIAQDQAAPAAAPMMPSAADAAADSAAPLPSGGAAQEAARADAAAASEAKSTEAFAPEPMPPAKPLAQPRPAPAANAAAAPASDFARTLKREAPPQQAIEPAPVAAAPAMTLPEPPAPPPMPPTSTPAVQNYGYQGTPTPADAADRRQDAEIRATAAKRTEAPAELSAREKTRARSAPQALGETAAATGAVAAPPPPAPPAPAAAAPATAQRAADASKPDLDAIQVTGSRIAAPPDAQLPPQEWLQRIRDYRDDGDLDRARQSLREFRRLHPRARIPEDLRPLLK
ncbi:hypothetical protein J5226_20805 [Lysobacter sp. K5869]|uniref:hypothetical protein n=1 Tax=Lysobacter sp. K5869 TaxID=2820808 RepID=UPI001C0647D9|nr:hypothetical protein [Lysobacter sp. K5869]QWP76013.1 hypothetical protein J5226_20805 [Lysobacter sp. K5869]